MSNVELQRSGIPKLVDHKYVMQLFMQSKNASTCKKSSGNNNDITGMTSFIQFITLDIGAQCSLRGQHTRISCFPIVVN